MPELKPSRRRFLGTAAAGLAIPRPATAASANRVIGANDRINIGFIGVGGRGRGHLRRIYARSQEQADVQVVAVSDIYTKRKERARLMAKLAPKDVHHEYRDMLSREDVDAVYISSPDHWHAPMTFDALDSGKDVYLEKPMTYTLHEAREVAERVRLLKRVLQVGSQHLSEQRYHRAREVIAKGWIGQPLWTQNTYSRNSLHGEWNYRIDEEGTPENIDWNLFQGPAPAREFNAYRYFRWRKYWDYSGGIATDLFDHVVAPLNICWEEPQFPYRVAATGGIYAFKDREVPDTFNLLADFAKGHSLVLSSSMANSTHIPGLLRGQHGTITMVDHGKFEGRTDHITIAAERAHLEEFVSKWGYQSVDIPVEETPRDAHISNFFECMRTRQKPVLDADTAYRAQVTISMGVESFRRGKILYFDPAMERVVEKAPATG